MNFSAGLVLMFAVGTLLVSSLALMTPWLQVLSNYPVATAGLVMAPRGLGNFATIMLQRSAGDARWTRATWSAAGLVLLC